MKKYILMIFMILLTTFVYAKPVEVIQESQPGSLSIAFPSDTNFQINSPFKIHFHLYNSTGSLVLLDQGEYCTFHLYNNTNNHILEENLTLDSNQIDYHTSEITISEKGDYPFLLFCDTTLSQDGFIASEIRISEDGQEHDDSSVFIAVAVLIIGSIALMFTFSTSLSGDEVWMQPLKILINMVSLFLILVGLGWGLQILKYQTLLSGSVINMISTIYFAILFVVIPILLFFLVRFIYELMNFMQDLQGKSGGGWNG